MKIEWWRFIPGFDCKYMVSDYGRVLSLNYMRTGKIKILKQNIKGKYLCVSLHINGKLKTPHIHRLVAEAFIENPNKLPCINHKNEIKTDNRACNLEYCDWKYNINYGTRTEKVSKKLTNRSDISTPVKQYTPDGEFVDLYPSIREAARQVPKGNASNISQCCKGKTKSSVGFIWKYAQLEDK